jgi:hypothetical protein
VWDLLEAGDTLRLLAESLGVFKFDIRETAALIKRSPETVDWLLSKYQLPRSVYYRTIRRRRIKIVELSPAVVRWLRDVIARKDPGPVPPR